jgi:hypothetical protein
MSSRELALTFIVVPLVCYVLVEFLFRLIF